MKGNQEVFDIPYTDPYTARANQVNEGFEGLFPFIMPDPGPPFFGQAGPWEWVSIADLNTIAPFLGQTSADVDTAVGGALLTNPNILDKSHAMPYIDTIQGYLAPRIVQALQLPGFYNSIEEILNNDNITLYPNPATNIATIQLDGNALVESIELFDVTGKAMEVDASINDEACIINTGELPVGVYTIRIRTNNGSGTSKLIKN